MIKMIQIMTMIMILMKKININQTSQMKILIGLIECLLLEKMTINNQFPKKKKKNKKKKTLK
jgi:hypothetical protein